MFLQLLFFFDIVIQAQIDIIEILQVFFIQNFLSKLLNWNSADNENEEIFK